LLCLAAAAPEAARALELTAVFASAGITPPARVRFEEARYNPLFEVPLELSGYLEYPAPGSLHKVVEAPFSEAFRIDDGNIRMQVDGEERELPAAAGRGLEAILGAIEAILSGDVAKLETIFEYELTGAEDDWSLELTPRSRRMSRQLERLTVSGTTDSVSTIVIDLHDGERHVMEILRVSTNP
jgi:hypothetical protein